MGATDNQRVTIGANTGDPWRYTCPNGHTSWSRCNQHWWCKSCSEQHRHDPDVDPEHQYLLDQKTGRRLSRDDVEYAADGPSL